MDRLNSIKSEDLVWSEKEAREWMKWQKRTDIDEAEKRGIQIGKTEGIRLGRAEGIETNTINMIKSMLENKADYEFISKVTGKSIDEIKEIENSMNEE